jgi:hypothetical protein
MFLPERTQGIRPMAPGPHPTPFGSLTDHQPGAACQSYAWVTIADTDRTSARASPRHALAALNGITGAHVDWADSKGLSEWERKALELAEE